MPHSLPSTRLSWLFSVLLVVRAVLRVGIPLAVVWGLMYESWSPLAGWLAAAFTVEGLLWLGDLVLRPRKRGPERW